MCGRLQTLMCRARMQLVAGSCVRTLGVLRPLPSTHPVAIPFLTIHLDCVWARRSIGGSLQVGTHV